MEQYIFAEINLKFKIKTYLCVRGAIVSFILVFQCFIDINETFKVAIKLKKLLQSIQITFYQQPPQKGAHFINFRLFWALHMICYTYHSVFLTIQKGIN